MKENLGKCFGFFLPFSLAEDKDVLNYPSTLSNILFHFKVEIGKVMMENFPNLMREKVTYIEETQRVPIKRNTKRPTSRHIIIKMAKFQDKEKILKAAREKQEVTYKGTPVRLAVDFSMEMLQARKEWQEIFQVMRTRGLQPRLYPARFSIKMKGHIRSFPDKRSLKEYTSTKPPLQEMLKGLL